jgi:hypothetical protein
MGRAYRYFHRLSHIVITVSDGVQEAADDEETEE